MLNGKVRHIALEIADNFRGGEFRTEILEHFGIEE